MTAKMLHFILITNDPQKAAMAVKAGVSRVMVDLEIMGKADRQPASSLISGHKISDISVIRNAVPEAELMVRINPHHAGSAGEIAAAISHGANFIMLPMVTQVADMRAVKTLCGHQVKLVPLIEHIDALQNLEAILDAGADEAYLGLNDLHLSLKQHFMFQPLADGLVDQFVNIAKTRGIRYGFGGIGAMGAGLLRADAIIKEHARLGCAQVILSRAFDKAAQDAETDFAQAYAQGISALRAAYEAANKRSDTQVSDDIADIRQKIADITTQIQAKNQAKLA
jgi:hypothetical protein